MFVFEMNNGELQVFESEVKAISFAKREKDNIKQMSTTTKEWERVRSND